MSHAGRRSTERSPAGSRAPKCSRGAGGAGAREVAPIADQAIGGPDRGSSARTLGMLAGARAYLGRTRREIACDAIAATIGIIVVFPALALVLDRRPVIDLFPVTITPENAGPGEKIRIEWETFTRRSCSGEVQQMIIDSTNRVFYFAPEAPAYKVVGMRQHFVKDLMVPRGSSPGQARYISRIYRWCNELQRLIWPMVEETSWPFTIGKP